jgi:hypothetical protein
MSILRSKHSGWTWEGRRTPFTGGGSGGGGGPTQTTTYSTNIPEYARPYVENMLQSTQAQIYNEDMTGFRPYQPYSTNVSDYVAGFSPLQQSAQQAAYYMQAPQQFGAATGLAGASGLGGLGLARQMAGTGREYTQMATDPFAIQSYMSPYMQNVVDYQKGQALRDYEMAAPYRAAKAVGQGAFGGSRQAIENAEAQRTLMSQLQGIEAQGRQSAFQQAQQAQQFGANLGLQGRQAALGGLGAATQAAGTLGGLGAQQFGAEKDIIGLQSQMGAQQQALEQQKINQAIQDYAIAQQYPFMQLGLMNAMLRGLPLQTQTTQLYQAQPTALQQGVGLFGAGASLFGRKEGGVIKEYREGGITQAYAPGGKVMDSTRAQLEEIADMPGGMQRLEQIRASSESNEVRKMAAQVLMEKQLEAKAADQNRMSGIALAGGPAFASQGMAGGGIVAFYDNEDQPVREGMPTEEDKVLSFEEKLKRSAQAPKKPFEYKPVFSGFESKLGQFQPAKKYTPEQLDEIARGQGVFPEGSAALPGMPPVVETAKKAEEKQTGTKGAAAAQAAENKAAAKGDTSFAKFLAEIKEAGPKGQIGAQYEKFLDERLGKSAERLSRDERMAMAKGFLKFASTPAPGGIGQAAAAGLTEYATGVEAARKAQDTMENEAQKARMDLDKARRAEERGDVAAAQEAYNKYEDRMNRIKTAQISAGAAGQAGRFEREAVERVMAENPGMKFADALQIVKGAGRFESTEVQRMKAASEALNKNIAYMRLAASKKPEDKAKAEQIKNEIFANFGLLAPGGGIGGGQTTTPGVMRFDAQGNLIKG